MNSVRSWEGVPVIRLLPLCSKRPRLCYWQLSLASWPKATLCQLRIQGGTLQEEGDSLTLSAVLLFPQAAVALAWHAGRRGGSFPAGPSVLHLLPGQHSTWTPLLSSSGPNPQLPKVTHGGSPGAHTAF